MRSTSKTNRQKTGIDPATLLAISDLELRARIVVEGIWAGLHRSPLEGFSVEFTEYRQYTQGDDLRYLDWKALAKTDREYIKKFEDETNLSCNILLDTSKSMSFGSSGYSKSKYAETLAATFGYFLLQQRDVVGLARIDSEVRDYLPARWKSGHLRHLLALLEKKSDGAATRMGQAIEQLLPLYKKPCIILILSDFLSAPSDWESSLAHLVACGHDVRTIQILDQAEQTLDYGKASQWENLETLERVYVDPVSAKKGYLEKFSEHQLQLKKALEEIGITHQIALTNEPLDYALLEMMRLSQGRSRLLNRKGNR